MLIRSAEYKASYVDVAACPKAEMPEFAFVGRSNVGKSSLINYICGRKALSKVSNTPGKTQTINYFEINHRFNFVDLPGYGFAKKSIALRNKWDNMIRNYLLKREQLMYVCLLVDSRIPPQKADLDFAGWMGKNHIPLIIIFTKADKPGNRETTQNIARVKNDLLKQWEELPEVFVTSAEKKEGKEELLGFMYKVIEEFYRAKGEPKEGYDRFLFSA